MLVSIPVVTYNSADFVIETLESVFNQTYDELELIICDDCSKDATVNLVREWIQQERVKKRFSRIEVLTVPENTGVSANVNRAIKASLSDWIGMVAGDDVFLPNKVKDNMEFVRDNPDAQIIFSQVKVYQDTFEEKNYIKSVPNSYPNNVMDKSFGAEDQYKLLLLSDRIQYTPSYFFNKQALEKVGGYDESNRLVEDYPMWLKLTSSGEKLYYFHKATVGYRMHSNATNNNGQDVLIKPSVINSFLARKKYAHPHLPRLLVLQENWIYNIAIIFKKIGITKKTKRNEMLYKFSTVYANPFFYCNAILKKIN